MRELLDQVVAASGLNASIAPFTISRLLVRAGVQPRTLTREQLAAALPQIEEGLAIYLDDEALARARIALRELAGG